ncbi:MAG: GTPase HflX, partial [Lachnospiraceae bacterium]|nr:GTPase HflX [Lachnospiraceae bacterium]
IYLSAKNRIGMEELIRLIEKKLSGGYRECTLCIPYTDGRAVSYLNEHAVVYETEYLEEGVRLRVNCRAEDYGYYEKYVV